ncbi:type II toxin-antitoxin system Phd/YefM family antitoxin [Candidatus Dojkabacteria bacterium]|uniref:Antitoxin n=1 Tax=Candidatus Dojkabacteria bacterium TaxID=2099670 RepID=A0A5C7J5W3_9BACT|nr:MAG: type II toxin-antitoxin system Phd/YefM family antitoxin [Candidatus Dojkabacteria bacterium]
MIDAAVVFGLIERVLAKYLASILSFDIIDVDGGCVMTTTVSAMEARHRFGEILNRVNLVHENFIIERKGQALAAIVPISALNDLKLLAKKGVERFLETSGSDLSDEEAMRIANEEIKLHRLEQKKRKK